MYISKIGRLKTSAESVSSDQMRRNAYHIHVAHMQPPLLSAPSKRSIQSAGGLWTMKACMTSQNERAYSHPGAATSTPLNVLDSIHRPSRRVIDDEPTLERHKNIPAEGGVSGIDTEHRQTFERSRGCLAATIRSKTIEASPRKPKYEEDVPTWEFTRIGLLGCQPFPVRDPSFTIPHHSEGDDDDEKLAIREEKEPRNWQTSYTMRAALAKDTSASPTALSIEIAHHLGKYEEDVHIQELTIISHRGIILTDNASQRNLTSRGGANVVRWSTFGISHCDNEGNGVQVEQENNVVITPTILYPLPARPGPTLGS
ncbi:hypothetical protein EDD15DRAFT_2522392 [Pisolithus albus]|nr:hypothetical protein EDD15DRAFT_2522392 [Pisolithus albus]